MDIKLFVFDIDGVLTAGEGAAWDLALFERLRELNQQARTNPSLPSVSLCTGRPSPYVEAVVQAMAGWRPAIFEHGAGMYHPESYRFAWHPAVQSEGREALAALVAQIDRALVRPGRAFWQPGKSICYTLLPAPPLTLAGLEAEVRELMAEQADRVVVLPAAKTLNIHPRGIDKGTGLQWLVETTSIDPRAMAGVGDTNGDVPFLEIVGFPAAPANATPAVQRLARYVSPYSAPRAVHDILDHLLAR